MRRNSKRPTQVASILESNLFIPPVRKKLVSYACFQEWPTIVGEQIAKIATPEKITRGRILVIRVLDATWAQELALKKHEILDGFARLAEKSGSRKDGGALFDDIRFVVSGPRTREERENLKLVVHS